MKKFFIISLAFAAALFVSCNNVIEPLDNLDDNSQAPAVEGKTITFSATIDVPQTKASLDGLNIKWSDGDYIGVATDKSATIVAYPVSNISEDGLSCSLQVNAVEGATTYYAVFKGSLGADSSHADQAVAADNFSSISFDTSTKTFSGLSVGSQQVASGSLSSHLWYTNGYPLSMAGKSNGNTLVMKPCLALVKVQIAAESVPADHFIVEETYNNPTYNVNHNFSYSALRGFNLYQKGNSTIYSSGDFTVQVADDGNLTVTAVGNDSNRDYRQISQEEKLLGTTTGENPVSNPYYMCLIPGGTVSSFKIDFLGYTNDSGAYDYAAHYTMTKSGVGSVKPGDFFDLGTLNPLGRKKAKNHSEADAADAEAAFDYAIDIDGVFSDWTDVSHTFTTNSSGLVEWKYTTDSKNLYFLYKITASKIEAEGSSFDNSPYIYVGFDTNRNASDGGSAGGGIGAGMEVELLIRPWFGDAPGTPQCEIGNDNNGHIKQYSGSGWTTLDEKLKIGGAISGDYCYVEVRVPLSILGNPTGPINVNHSFRWAPTGSIQIMPEAATITAEDQTVDVGQSVAIGATTNSTAAITYTSNNPLVATVDSDGLIAGVAAGSTTITMNVAAVDGEYTSATKTINVTVTEPFTPAIEIDGDISDWSNISASYNDPSNTRIREWRFTSDEKYVYFLFKMRKNRVDNARELCIIFDTDNSSSTGETHYKLVGAEQDIVSCPFTNVGEATQPVCVNGYDSTGKVNGNVDTNAIKVWAYDDGSSLDSSSNIYLEMSIPRSKLSLPSPGNTFTISCSYDYYTTDYFRGFSL